MHPIEYNGRRFFLVLVDDSIDDIIKMCHLAQEIVCLSTSDIVVIM